MKISEYMKLKSDDFFRNKTVLVCENCYYLNNEINSLSGFQSPSIKKFQTVLKEEERNNHLKISLENIKVFFPYVYEIKTI